MWSISIHNRLLVFQQDGEETETAQKNPAQWVSKAKNMLMGWHKTKNNIQV